jgi:hypothetical protein
LEFWAKNFNDHFLPYQELREKIDPKATNKYLPIIAERHSFRHFYFIGPKIPLKSN